MKKLSIKLPDIHEGKAAIDAICLLGADLSILEKMLKKGAPVNEADIQGLKERLSVLNDFAQKTWKVICKNQERLNRISNN